MLPKSKLDRAFRWSRERRMEREHEQMTQESQDPLDDSQLPTDAELRAEGKKVELEKGDLKAMIFAGLFTILPVCILVLGLLALLCYLLI